jgi:arylformamidase
MDYDISLPIESLMMVYKQKPEKVPQFQVQNNLDRGGSYETTMAMNLHTGTHIDFPLHMQKNGKTSSGFNPTRLITDVRVIDCGEIIVIDEAFLAKQQVAVGSFILLKTKSSFSKTFLFDFPYLSESGAKYCSRQKLQGVGIDALGIERDQPNHQTHHELLNHQIIILEGLRLQAVPEGVYEMIALPMSIQGVDALPVRAILRTKK